MLVFLNALSTAMVGNLGVFSKFWGAGMRAWGHKEWESEGGL